MLIEVLEPSVGYEYFKIDNIKLPTALFMIVLQNELASLLKENLSEDGNLHDVINPSASPKDYIPSTILRYLIDICEKYHWNLAKVIPKGVDKVSLDVLDSLLVIDGSELSFINWLI